ncbi:MAG: hypothetical protein WD069_19070, partial [Planctomycetales bacterium]
MAVIWFLPQRPEEGKRPDPAPGKDAVAERSPSGTASTVRPTPVSLADSAKRVYSGERPAQTGVVEGAIDRTRVAVLRGFVHRREGQPLDGVRIHIEGHPEFGATMSGADGGFSLAVNGGGLLCVHYSKEGYLPACRHLSVPWQDYAWLPDVRLVAPDAAVTTVKLAKDGPTQVARASGT